MTDLELVKDDNEFEKLQAENAKLKEEKAAVQAQFEQYKQQAEAAISRLRVTINGMDANAASSRVLAQLV